MSEAISDYPIGDKPLAADSEGASSRLIAFYQGLPDEVPSSDIRSLVSDRTLGPHLKRRQLLATALGVYAKRLPEVDLSVFPDETTLDENLLFADYLLVEAKTDTDTATCLEFLDEAVSPFTKLSPIHEAERIERLVPHHTHLTKGVVLATKLWTFEHRGDPEDMPTSFFESRRKYRPIMKGRMAVRGFTNKFAVY